MAAERGLSNLRASDCVGLLFVLAAGCGTQSGVQLAADAGGVLDCAWATGDNCWKQTIAAATGCLPPRAASAVAPTAPELGVLSADGTVCSYATGQSVTFAIPLFIGGNENPGDFTVTTQGAPCLAQEQETDGIAVTTSVGTVNLAEDLKQTTLTAICPDGTRYSGVLANLSSCMAAVPGQSIGSGGFTSPDGGVSGSLSFTLDGTSDAGTPVFYCRTR
jgi:hypothetical protein